MRIEIIFLGSPKDIALKIDNLNINGRDIFGQEAVWFIPGQMGFELPNDANPVYISTQVGANQVFAEARRLPGNRTIITLNVDDDVWGMVEKSWSILLKELNREGWIETNSSFALSTANVNNEDQPWMEIPDIASDRRMIELWHRGFQRDEIAKKLSLTKGRVTNRISELRQKHGHKVVPLDKDRGKSL